MGETINEGPPIAELNRPFRYHVLQAAIINRGANVAREIANPLRTKVPDDLKDLFVQGKKIELSVAGEEYRISSMEEYQAFMTAAADQLRKLQSAIPEPEESNAPTTSSPFAALKKSKDDNPGIKEEIDALIASIEKGDYTINSLKYDVMGVNNKTYTNSTITDEETRKESIETLNALDILVDAANKSLSETYTKRCEAVVGKLVQWAKEAQQACGVTEQSSKYETWALLRNFVEKERSMINRADPHHVQMLLDIFLYNAKQYKDKSGQGEIDGEKLLKILDEANSKPAETFEKITAPAKESRTLLQRLFGLKKS